MNHTFFPEILRIEHKRFEITGEIIDLLDSVEYPKTGSYWGAPVDRDVRNKRAEHFILSFHPHVRPNPTRLGSAYGPRSDCIYVPAKDNFVYSYQFYAGAFHELVHLTGHPRRLNRVFPNKNQKCLWYGPEEIIAQLGSAFLCEAFGIHKPEHHAGYIKKMLKIGDMGRPIIERQVGAAMRAVLCLEKIANANYLKHKDALQRGKRFPYPFYRMFDMFYHEERARRITSIDTYNLPLGA